MTEAGPPPSARYSASAGLVRALKVLFLAHAATSLVAAWSQWLRLRFWDRHRMGLETTPREMESHAVRHEVIENVMDVIWIALAVLFLVWIYRASRNLRALGVRDLRFTPGWCVGWFLVPIFNLWKPYQAVKELRERSRPREEGAFFLRRSTPLVGLWWTLWMLAIAHGLFSGFTMLNTRHTGGGEAAARLQLMSDLLRVPPAILALLVVAGIARLQERMRVESAFE